MPSVSFDYVHWSAGASLEVLVCALAIARGLFRRLPLFSSYLALVVVRDLAGGWPYLGAGYQSRLFFYFYWISQGVLLLARGLAVGEICRRILRPYRGVWALARQLLIGTAVILVVSAALNALGSRFWMGHFILRAERGLELTVVAVLVLLLALCRYYRVERERLVTLLALGLGLYSAVQVVNNSFIQELMTHYFQWWSNVRTISFEIALVIWCWALRKPLPEPEPEPVLLEQGVYDELTPLVCYRLRELNDRLLEMLK